MATELGEQLCDHTAFFLLGLTEAACSAPSLPSGARCRAQQSTAKALGGKGSTVESREHWESVYTAPHGSKE